MSVPSRRTPEVTVDQWNEAMRASPLYQRFIQRNGLVGKVGGWSRAQQAAWERELAANGIEIPGGMHIDQGGNLNQKNRFGKIAIISGAAALAAFGIPGVFPGVFTAGGGAGAGAGAAGAGAGAAGSVGAGGAAGAAGGAAARGFPWGPVLGLVAGAGSSVANNIANRRTREDAQAHDLEIEQLRDRRERDLLGERLSFEESLQNPWRHQLNQARSIGLLGLMEGSSYNPYRLEPSGKYGASIPRTMGGFSFQSDPTTNQAAGILRKDVMQGTTRRRGEAPGLDVLQLLAGTDPGGADAWTRPGGPVRDSGGTDIDDDPRYADMPEWMKTELRKPKMTAANPQPPLSVDDDPRYAGMSEWGKTELRKPQATALPAPSAGFSDPALSPNRSERLADVRRRLQLRAGQVR